MSSLAIQNLLSLPGSQALEYSSRTLFGLRLTQHRQALYSSAWRRTLSYRRSPLQENWPVGSSGVPARNLLIRSASTHGCPESRSVPSDPREFRRCAGLPDNTLSPSAAGSIRSN